MPIKIKRNIAVSDEGLVFNPENGESFSLNPLGTDILALIKEGRSDKEISEKIISLYNVDKSTFDKDFHDFINLLGHYELTEADEQKKS